MTTSCLATRVETWLSSTWHVKVPAQWLEACIDWIQQENGGFSLAQASLNKQVFEQWLFTDLRDLEYPVLPDCLLNYPKGELNGFYSIQIDSLVDVSQPAYSQLQKLRGKNTVNEEITANTERIVRSWEAKPSRMLMLQLTDGVHHIQGMEYHSVPVLHCDLPPGTKVMIQGNVVYRLGVLLLKPENVRLLGGKVDSLIEENAKERILTRLLGEGDENSPNGVVSNNGECVIPQPIDEISQGLGPSDEELLASLEENNELMISEAPVESGYCTRSTRLNSTTYSLPPNTGNYLQQGSAVFTEEQNIQGDFDDFPLDDDLFLVEEIEQEERQDPNRNISVKNQPAGEKNPGEGTFAFVESTRDFSTKRNVKCTQNLDDCLESRSNKGNEKSSISNNKLTDINVESQQSSECVQAYKIKNKCLAVGLDTPPFTYLSLLLSNKPKDITTVKIKAFIVTLTGNLTSSNGFWSVAAKISDGTAFLEVDFADEILTSLIGFSVPEMKQLRKDPVLFPKLKEGLQNCQRELIDLCCLMTVEFNPSQTKARVIILQDINENDLNNLKRRLYV
ncbi:recQ-mediated genome instability protein 1 isoform X2 [Sceloporus undulatus]|nr:recQ-mediated genome instability protein 1 isoform X2 [Sceloporus undulatus]XP_042305122.1 recQ-mediated genome instability protein 1 isoform X2 [Sceloporus undulatus]XP_042305123.1 recQ-mediated genome instability protein 1 isoform X2 [Sceloporus undulatus]